MKRWYLFYANKATPQILQRVVAEIQDADNQDSEKQHQIGAELDDEKPHQVGGEFPLPFALVPWGQHIEIIVNCKTLDEALFYVRETIEKGLSRPALRNVIKANLFEHQGKIINNFSEHLPAIQSKLVQEVLKENYDFGFATVNHEIYDEAELEEALSKNITAMLLEMGTGFAFIGKQKEFIVGGRTNRTKTSASCSVFLRKRRSPPKACSVVSCVHKASQNSSDIRDSRWCSPRSVQDV